MCLPPNIGTQHNTVRIQIRANLRQGLFTEAICVWQRQADFHLCHIFPRNRAQLFAGSEFCGQHFRDAVESQASFGLPERFVNPSTATERRALTTAVGDLAAIFPTLPRCNKRPRSPPRFKPKIRQISKTRESAAVSVVALGTRSRLGGAVHPAPTLSRAARSSRADW